MFVFHLFVSSLFQFLRFVVLGNGCFIKKLIKKDKYNIRMIQKKKKKKEKKKEKEKEKKKEKKKKK